MKKILLGIALASYMIFPANIIAQTPVIKKSDIVSSLPKITVSGNEDPINTDYDSSVSLTANLDNSQLPKNLIKVKYKWLVIDNDSVRKNVTLWPDGSKIFFGVGSKPRSIKIMLWTGCLYQIKDDKGVIQDVDIDAPEPILTTVVVGVPTPPIPPAPPQPPIPPIPVPNTLPDGQYKIAQKVYDLVMQDVPLASRIACPNLADSYDQTAKAISAGNINGVGNIFKSLQVGNMAAMTKSGVSATDWAQWNKLCGDAVYALYESKQINTNADWQQLLTEIAIGLRGVK